MSPRPPQQIHPLRVEEGCTFRAEAGLEFLPHLPVEFRGELVVGPGEADHALVEGGEILEEAAGVEEKNYSSSLYIPSLREMRIRWPGA